MATEIKLRRGTKAQHDDGSGFTGAVGEITVDTTDDTLRVHDGSLKGGHVIAKLSDVQAEDTLAEMNDVNLTSPADGSLLKYDNASSKWIDSAKLTETSSGIDVTGTVTADGVALRNNEKITLGAESGGKLEIYEATGGNGVIEQTGAGDIVVKGQNGSLRNDANANLIAWDNARAELYWRGASGAGAKLTTTETGIDVTGTVTADGVSLGDNEKAFFGAGNDLQIYHDGSNSYITDSGTGNLLILANDFRIRNAAGNEDMLQVNQDGDVKVSYDGVTKLATTATGINVTGTVTADGVSLEAGDKLIFGAEANSSLQIYEDDDGGKSRIAQYGGGDLWIQGENISLRNDDAETLINTGHTQAFMYWQGDTGTKGERLRTTHSGIDVTGAIECDTSLQIQSTGSDADAMPDLYMTNIETAADAQNLGMIHFRGYNDASTPTIESYANIYAQQVDVSDGAEKGKLVFQARNGSGYVETLEVNKDGIDVTGTVEADAFTGHMTSVVSSSAQTIATTNYGVRKIHTGGAVAYTFNATGAISGTDIGKAIVIANAGTATITCNFTTSKFYKMISGVNSDLSGSGLASITIAKGGIAEIVITQTNKALVFGAGVA